MLRTLAVAGLVVATLATTASCSDDGGPDSRPAEEERPAPAATIEAFCVEYGDPMAGLDPEGPPDFVAMWTDYAHRVEAVGLPAGAPVKVHAGLAAFVKSAEQLPPDVDPMAVAEGPSLLSAAEDDAYAAFDRWASKACGLGRSRAAGSR